MPQLSTKREKFWITCFVKALAFTMGGVLAFSELTFAADPVYVPVTPSSGVQLGMEIEIIGRPALRNVMNNFDVVDVPRTVLKDLSVTQIDAYLTPQTFDLLPEDVRQRLTGGRKFEVQLDLTSKMPVSRVPKAGFILPEAASPKLEKPGFILPDSAPYMPAAKELIIPDGASGSTTWSQIESRWKEMARETRVDLIDANRLSPLLKANLVMDGKITTDHLRPKADLPPRIANLLSRLSYTKEKSVIEFRHLKPVTSTEAYVHDVELFSELAGIRRYIDDPSKMQVQELEFTYHMHASHPNASKAVGDRLNRLRLFELRQAGRGTAALGAAYSFTSLEQKGLVRKVAVGHYETRAHVDAPAVEVQKMVDLITMPRSEAVQQLEEKLEMHTREIVDELTTIARESSRVTDPAKRDALREVVRVNFDVLGRAADSGWKKSLIDKLTSTGTEAEQRAAMDELFKLNTSAFGFNFLVPLQTKTELTKNFGRIAGSYAAAGSGEVFLSDMGKSGLTEKEIFELIKKHATEIMATDRNSSVESKALFLRSLPSEAAEALWAVVPENLRSNECMRAFKSLQRAH